MADNKKRAGKYPNNQIKSSNFLPKTFQTNTNKVWLDSTLDQMISKGNLKDYSGFFGSVHGKDRTINDTYVDIKNNNTAKQISQLQPAIVTKNSNGEVTNTLAFDDVVNAVSTNFSEYNYASAYSTQSHVYNPPINTDMLINYSSYYWAQNLPTYVAENNTLGVVDIINEIQNQSTYQLQDDNNTFDLHNGMVIKFDGDWGTATGITYIVSGVGTGINLIEFQDAAGKFRYTNQYKGNIESSGYWDRNEVYNVEHNTSSIYNSQSDSLAMIDAFNNDTTSAKPVFFDGFNMIRHESNNDKLVLDTYVRFPDLPGVYYLKVTKGKVTATSVTANSNLGESYDIENWDYESLIETAPDYIVIARDDNRHTAWSRINAWVHVNCINTYKQIMPHLDTTKYLNSTLQAKRSIIEFLPNMNLFDGCDYNSNIDNHWIGHVDYYIKPEGDYLPIPSGNDLIMPANCNIAEHSFVLFTDTYTTHLYKMTAGSVLVEEKAIVDGSCAFIDFTPFDDLKQYQKADVYFDNGIQISQSKIAAHQEPLFKLYSLGGVEHSEYDREFFGSKIFGYKLGNTHVDPILGKKLSYKDTPKGAEIEFENYANTYKLDFSITDNIDPKLGYVYKGKGYNYFKIDDKLTTLYITSDITLGAWEHLQYTITDTNNTLVIPVGYNNFTPTFEYVVYKLDDVINIKEITEQGTSINKNVDAYKDGILVDTKSTIKITNLLDQPLILANNGETVLVKETKTLSSLSNDTVTVGTDAVFKITSIASIDNHFHRLTVNGENTVVNSVTINSNDITINTAHYKEGDIIDLEYLNVDTNNQTSNASFPTLWQSNSLNETFDSMTISETAEHWKDMMLAMPGFEGNVFGKNNFSSIQRLSNYGGKIMLHNDSGVMHDVQYMDKTKSITGALYEQGQDYDAFVLRFRNQVQRLYAKNSSMSIQEIVAKTLSVLLANKKGTNLYNTSNMLYTIDPITNSYTIDNNQTEFTIDKEVNGDLNIRDHVYVWLTENVNSAMTRRILLKDKEYSVNGNKVTLLITPQLGANGEYPSVDIDYYQMDSSCNVPQSMVKLGLQFGQQPQVVDQHLITHDNRKYPLASNYDLHNMNSQYFDIVNAAQYELECMIYSGLVKQDNLYTSSDNYKTIDKFIPSQHRYTWYTLDQLDDYVYTYYAKWARANNKDVVLEELIFDETDPEGWTWNYRDSVQFILGSNSRLNVAKLPGHYVGIYNILFGTATPHTTPWHMLGLSFKPTWWDTHYSWTDATKRAALIDALENGIVSEPGTPIYQEIEYARTYWNWNTQSPVDNTGALIDPAEVLTPGNHPSLQQRAKPFVFGDWGPTEQQFRQTAQCYSVTLDAILKLLPARAFTEFFQPGLLSTVQNDNSQFKVAEIDTELFNNKSFITPGYKSKKVLSNIIVTTNHNYANTSNQYSYVYGNDFNQYFEPVVNFTTDGSVESILVNKRLFDITNEAVYTSNILDENIEIEYKYTEAEFTANGISQAQYNYNVRNNYSDDLYETYNYLDTNLMQKIDGYTRKDSVEIFAESGIDGSFKISNNDYDIVMHKEYPHVFVNASEIIIKREREGFQLRGLSNNRQEFKFVEPVTTSTAPFVTVDISGKVIKKYKKFVTQPSVIDYGTTLSKIQDVYTFILGYFEYLENIGFVFDIGKEAQANTFVRWTIRAVVNDEITLDLGNKITYNATHGNIAQSEEFAYYSNDIVFKNGTLANKNNIVVNRENNTATFESKNNSSFGSVSIAVVNYQHAFVFKNTTTFGNVVFDDVKHNRQDRLLARGGITKDWDGNKRAPGYLVFDDHIVQNFDSSVEETNEYYRTDVPEFNKDVKKAKDISIGNIDRDWLKDLHLDPNVVTKFYQGAIKEAGTNASVDRLARFIKGAEDIDVYEKYMFNHSYFGDTTRKQSTEIKLMQKEIGNNPQIIEFANQQSTGDSVAITENDLRFVNKNKVEFNITDFDKSQTKLNTAGNPLSTEARYYSFNTKELPNVYDSTADYATIESWSSTKSYGLGDIVRRQSALYKCKVDSTGLQTVNEGIFETGSITNPVFPYGTVVNIDNNPVTLTDTTTVVADIVATGSVASPTVNNLDQLAINGNVLTFRGTNSSQGVIGNAQLLGNIVNPQFQTVAGKTITINGTVVDFDNIPSDIQENTAIQNAGVTPPNVTEAFNVLPVTPPGLVVDTYTIVTPMSPTTYSISAVQVDGSTLSTSDYQITGQDITILNPSLTGGETISVVLTHTPVINLVDTYTIVQPLSVTGYQLVDVIVDGTTLTAGQYNLNGQAVTINNINNYNENDAIQFVLTHADNGMSTADILQTITNAVPNVTASQSNGAILLEFSSTNINATMTLSAGAVNAELGFDPAGEQSSVVVGITYAPLTTQEILDQINQFASFTIDNITASENNNQIVLTKTNTSYLETMTVGTGASIFGFDSSYTANTSNVNTDVGIASAVSQIQAHLTAQNITDVTVTRISNRINISSTRQVLDFGNTAFNSVAGLPTGEQSNLNTSIENTFISTEWDEVDASEDPTLFNIWVVNDSDYGVDTVGNVKTKFSGWNIFQVQNHGLYPRDDSDPDGCAICAGSATSDGNDAQITTVAPHGLVAGDYILLTNTTTQPAIDGIHKVTQVHPTLDNVFYIDKFINVCGGASSVMILRPQRFEDATQRDSSANNIPNRSKVYVDVNVNNELSTNVFTRNSTANTFEDLRFTNYRVANNDIENITIYDFDKNKIVKQFELFDPLRGVIPGVANAEIDMQDNIDLAAYNMSSDENYSMVEQNYWSEDQLGKRWWDTSTVTYYDYDQSDYAYQSSHWGKLFPGSSIDVYEWTKSTVSPEDYAAEVENNAIMFGTVATGEAYYVFDSQLQENYYYYSTVEEWDATLSRYITVYYFWVKNKTTIPYSKNLTTSAVADIINDPTSNGISWFAALTPPSTSTQTSGNAFILSNAGLYLNDTSTVVQINRVPNGINHNSWTTIAKDKDLIPDYYYIGLRNNLATVDALEQTLPNYYAHPYNRFGDDRSIKQAWFMDHANARLNARVVINELLKGINLLTNYSDTWDREFVKANMPNKTWKWTNYVSDKRNIYATPSLTFTDVNQLLTIDTSIAKIAKLKIRSDGLDRSEIWEYVDNEWIITEKANATIELEEIVARRRAGWDNLAWDTTVWDKTQSKIWWRAIVDACRYDWFVGQNVNKFNKLFFTMVDFALGEQDQTNWVHKSTFVKLDITHNINTSVRKYTRSTVNNIIGYVNTVKPFHTKIDEILDTQNTIENVPVELTEEIKQHIIIDSVDFTSVFIGDTRDSGNNWDVLQGVTTGNDWSSTESYDNGAFHQPTMYASENDPLRQHNLHVDFGSVTSFTVQTNTSGSTVDNDTRTFVMLNNAEHSMPIMVALEESKATTIANITDSVITLADASAFADSGTAYVNNEFITFVKNANDLQIISRSAMNTFNLQHEVGSVIVDVTDSFLTTAETTGPTTSQITQGLSAIEPYLAVGQGQTMLNDVGESILTSTDSLTASELQSLGKGITI